MEDRRTSTGRTSVGLIIKSARDTRFSKRGFCFSLSSRVALICRFTGNDHRGINFFSQLRFFVIKDRARLHFHFIPVIDCGMTKGLSCEKGLFSSVRLIAIQKNRYRNPHSCNTRANNYSTTGFHRLWLSRANIMLCDKTPDCPLLVISAIDGNYLFHWISSIIVRSSEKVSDLNAIL